MRSLPIALSSTSADSARGPAGRGASAWAGRLLSNLSAAGWLPWLMIAMIAGVNAAGVWGIAVARRGALESADRVFGLETAARARAVESTLSSIRADLAFLAASPTMRALEKDLASQDPTEARWRRLAAEGALLLFLRGHPDVRSAMVESASGSPLVAAGRRGGVPVLWIPARAAQERDDPDAAYQVEGLLDLPAAPGAAQAARLRAGLDARALLARGRPFDAPEHPCRLSDRQGRELAGEPAGSGSAAASMAVAAAPVMTEGWSAPAPWTLRCARPREAALGLLEPIAARYRLTIVLNVAVMGLAVVLGSFGIQQGRRRQVLEARAREEARVRELERQLFHAERLGTVGRLAAGIAHEINNPLEGISNYLVLAREDLQRGDAASARRRLDGVQEGLERAAGIVRGVLAHADPAAPASRPADLNAIVSQSAGFVRMRREFAGIRFVMELDPDLPAVPGDQVTLGQLFLNLILNACEAQPEGGEVTVRTRAGGREVAAEVADRGPGVPEPERARIFEPFYSTKESTGLGLSICHGIARRHGGDLTVENRPGGGALFRLVLPLSPVPGRESHG
ncbi:MAG TPA: ATP-binding protein [Candidatus Polarisedimenticolia bacterium]|nr:ATP-binding protein [Candidatus Polarisedimenticolia bacterium]